MAVCAGARRHVRPNACVQRKVFTRIVSSGLWDWSAVRFLRKAIDKNGTPENIAIDKSGANTAAIESYNKDYEAGFEIRQVKYLNIIVEQVH